MRGFNGDERSLHELVKHLVVDQRNKFRVRNDNFVGFAAQCQLVLKQRGLFLSFLKIGFVGFVGVPRSSSSRILLIHFRWGD